MKTIIKQLKKFFEKKPEETGNVINHVYEHTPFSIKATELSYGKGYWTTWRVEVFRYKIKIGEYERGYHGFIKSTFHPFRVDNEWYALYSDDYTATKVAKLTSKFTYWCGTDGHAFGFCPVDFYVPRFYKMLMTSRTDDIHGECYEYFINEHDPLNIGDIYTNFGFVSGCVWGDDHSWKLRFIDLSGIKEKKLVVDDRFGYCELPDELSLKDCVYIDDPDITDIRITRTEYFSLRKNKYHSEIEDE